MASKALVQRQKQVDHVIGYIRTHADATAKILTVRAQKLGARGRIPDLLNAQHFQGFWLGKAYEELRRAESVYLAKKQQAPGLRERRDELVRTLYDKVVALRGFLDRVYGKPTAILLTGLEGKTPRDAFEMAEVGSVVLERLRAHGGDLPEPQFEGLEFQPEETAAGLEPLVRQLAETLRALDDWSRDTELLLVARNEARSELDEMLTGTHEMLEGFYVAAGLRHLVPGLRSPGASMRDALRSTPAASRRRAWQDLAEAGGRIPGSHPVQTRNPVGEPRDSSPSPDARPEKVRESPTIAASSPPDSASHPVQASLGVDGFGSETPILHFEPPDPASHPVRRRKSGENVAMGAIKCGPRQVGVRD